MLAVKKAKSKDKRVSFKELDGDGEGKDQMEDNSMIRLTNGFN